jgi:hypothetical protein
MARKSFIILLVGVAMFLFTFLSFADVPHMINYQGKLTTASGGCLNDTLQMTFTIYTDDLGTTEEWTETQTAVVVKEGIFNVLLGSMTPLPDSVFDGSVKYLGIQVESDPEMAPLKPMVTAAYAFHCATADSALNSPAAGIVSVDGVSNPGGNVDFLQQNAITITPNDPANTITFGETHSARMDNPHNVTAAQTGALISSDGVSNPGGNVDFLQQNAITITPNDPANTITFGETHSARMDNPHNVTAAQTGALASVDGVSNAGGNVDFIAGSNMTITPNDGANTITFSATGGGIGGSGTTNYIPKFTAATTIGNSVMYETAGGNIGIGTTSPNEQLEITENLRLPATTATAGIIKVGADRFIHNYGSGNTFVGANAGNLSMTGYSNTANGSGALPSNTTGYENTANGYWALHSNTTGHTNTANGYRALRSNTTGYYNTANGFDALYSNTTGELNTANGCRALRYNTTGSYNTALGYDADVSSGDFTNATAIGNGALVDASNKVKIGNTSVTSIGGYAGWTNFSDARYKKNVSENVPGLSFINKLKPITYTLDVEAIESVLHPPGQMREGERQEDLSLSAEEIASRQAKSQIVYTGFTGQEVEKAAQELGYDFSGVDAPKNDRGMYGLRYAEFVVPLVKAVQEQQQMIQEQQQVIQELQKRIEELEKK